MVEKVAFRDKKFKVMNSRGRSTVITLGEGKQEHQNKMGASPTQTSGHSTKATV